MYLVRCVSWLCGRASREWVTWVGRGDGKWSGVFSGRRCLCDSASVFYVVVCSAYQIEYDVDFSLQGVQLGVNLPLFSLLSVDKWVSARNHLFPPWMALNQ